MRTTQSDTVRARFFAPVEGAHHRVNSHRQCQGFSDLEYIESGVGRVLSDAQSGRDWVQRLRQWMNSALSVSNFFDALKSPRRLRYLEDIHRQVRGDLNDPALNDQDLLRQHSELDDFECFASDGHFEKASAHPTKGSWRHEPVETFYTINLRTHSMSVLDIARPVRKRENDIHALKRLDPKILRLDAPVGRKVLHVYDMASIDYQQWRRWKKQGIYLLSREKENSAAHVVGKREWDSNDPRNQGVLADEYVGVCCGLMFRRIRYRDAATGTVYHFMTNEMTLPPGLLAFLYKLRWDIEKAFDQKKNKLMEKKAWASSDVARTQQAIFICLTHNLLLIFERNLRREENIRDLKAEAKRRQRMETLKTELLSRSEVLNPLVENCLRLTQRSLQFIRWLRASIFQQTAYGEALTSLRPLMERYLS